MSTTTAVYNLAKDYGWQSHENTTPVEWLEAHTRFLRWELYNVTNYDARLQHATSVSAGYVDFEDMQADSLANISKIETILAQEPVS